MWDTDEVLEWLINSGFKQHSATFAAERINGQLLLHDLDDEVLEELGVAKPNRDAMVEAIEHLRNHTQCKNPPTSLSAVPTTLTPPLWGAHQVLEWLVSSGFGQHAAAFAAERINGHLLIHDLDDDILEELGVAKPDREAMLKAIEQLRNYTQSVDVAAVPLSPSSTASRRQPQAGLSTSSPKQRRDPNVLPPSSAERWMSCPASFRHEQQFPDHTSTFAAEGSYAHSVAELRLQLATGEPQNRDRVTIEAELAVLQENPWYSQKLSDHVDSYVQFVISEIEATTDPVSGRLPVVLIEERVSPATWAPAIRGTPDLVLVTNENVHVIDFKYGR
jgi:isochorismate hydrolase